MEINMLLDGAGKILETVPEVYEDGIKEAVVQTGKLTARIPRLLNALAADFDIWLMNREHKVKKVAKLLDEELQSISEENIVAPEPHIVIPALQAIALCMDEEILRNMYAKLLSSAMNINTKEQVHPSFVEIIKQMNRRDASNLYTFIQKNDTDLPIAEYRLFSKDDSNYKVAQTNVFLINTEYQDIASQATSISLLERLGLVMVDYTVELTPNNFYDEFIKTDEYISLLNKTSIYESIKSEEEFMITFPDKAVDEFRTIGVMCGVMVLTPYGKHFINICVDPFFNPN